MYLCNAEFLKRSLLVTNGVWIFDYAGLGLWHNRQGYYKISIKVMKRINLSFLLKDSHKIHFTFPYKPR